MDGENFAARIQEARRLMQPGNEDELVAWLLAGDEEYQALLADLQDHWPD